MKSASEESHFEYNRISERIQHALREASPEVPDSLSSSTDLDTVAVGGQFPVLDAFPCELEVGEGESTDPHPSSRDEAENSVPAAVCPPSPGSNHLLGSASATSTPRSRTRIGVHIQPDDYNLRRRTSDRHSQRGRSGSSAQPSLSSENTEDHHLTTPTPANDQQQDHHSTTPTPTPIPNFSPSHTPSHHSLQTEDENNEQFAEPESPHPFSEYNRYDPSKILHMLDRFSDA